MSKIRSVNDFVIKFANVNGSGSASANQMFAKGVFRHGVPVSPKNIFPSNIQGLPTWFEVRVNDKGYLGRKAGVDIAVTMNPQSYNKDIAEVNPGGYVLYDSSWKRNFNRDDINVIELPITSLCIAEFTNPKQRQLFKNLVYVGALAFMLDIPKSIYVKLIKEQFRGKEKLIDPKIAPSGSAKGHSFISDKIYKINVPINIPIKPPIMQSNIASIMNCNMIA